LAAIILSIILLALIPVFWKRDMPVK